MADPFLAEIVMFGGNFAPRGWAKCDGQLLSIAQYSAVFSLMGTTFGGDGRVTFGLPGMRGRVPVHWGSGPGVQPISWGQRGGSNTNSLSANNLPAHQHAFQAPCQTGDGETDEPAGNYPAKAGGGETIYASGADASMGSGNTGNNSTSNTPVNNMQPYLGILFIIALQGLFPSRN